MHADVIELTSRLVAIESVNPSLVPGGAGEAEIARYVRGWAEEAGLEAERDPVDRTAPLRARPVVEQDQRPQRR